MNILIDINHPAQVHNIKFLYHELCKDNDVIVTCKEIPIVENLLSSYNIPYIKLGRKGGGVVDRVFRQVNHNVSCLRLLKKYSIDIAFGSSVSNVHASFLLRTISIVTDDSDMSMLPMSVRYVYPFMDYLLTPDSLSYQSHRKQICYPGYHELAYLHPKRFRPDPLVLDDCGLKEDDPFFILRFTAFKAHHDVGMYGLSLEQKWQLIRLLEHYGRVLITSEAKDPEFEKYSVPISPEKMHSLMYYAQLLACDSQTMTTEAAILGTPAFRCNTFAGRLTIIEEIEKCYDLAYSFHPRHFHWMLKKIEQVLRRKDFKQEWAGKRQALIEDKIDVTAFWVWLLKNAPKSLEMVKNKAVDYDLFR